MIPEMPEIYLGLEAVSFFKHLPRQKRKGDGENCYFLFSTRALRQLDREVSHFSNRMIGRATFAVAQGPLTVSLLCIRFKRIGATAVLQADCGTECSLKIMVIIDAEPCDPPQGHGTPRRGTASFFFLSFPGEILWRGHLASRVNAPTTRRKTVNNRYSPSPRVVFYDNYRRKVKTDRHWTTSYDVATGTR